MERVSSFHPKKPILSLTTVRTAVIVARMVNMSFTESYLTPNARPSSTSVLTAGWILVGLALWQFLRPTVFPSPIDSLLALPSLWSDGLAAEVLSSLRVNLEALVLSALVGLPLCYLTRIPILTPVTAFLAKLRFAGSAVFYLPLLLVLDSPHSVKVGVLMLGELFYLVTAMTDVVNGIEEFRYDDARTLKMSEWVSIWWVNVRGTVPAAIDALRANAGMGWSMLMFVEGAIRSEGGVGVVLMNAEKHTNYDEFFAVVLVVVGVGVLQDWLIGQIKKAVCPYA